LISPHRVPYFAPHDSFAHSGPHWARDLAVVRRNLAAIQQTAHRLIVAIEGNEARGDAAD